MSTKTGMKNIRTALRLIKRTVEPLQKALSETKEFDQVEGTPYSTAAVRAIEVAIMEIEDVESYLDGRIFEHESTGA